MKKKAKKGPYRIVGIVDPMNDPPAMKARAFLEGLQKQAVAVVANGEYLVKMLNQAIDELRRGEARK